MKKFTTVAVIAAMALTTQAFAMGGGSKGGQTMPTTRSTSTMKSGYTMTTGTKTMPTTAIMSATGTMSTALSGTGMTKPQVAPGTPMQPAVTK